MCQYIIIKNVMDEAWLQQARDAIDANLDQVFLRGVGHDNDSSLGVADGPLAGTGRPDLKGLFELPNGHAAPFLRMLDHPGKKTWVFWPHFAPKLEHIPRQARDNDR